MKIRSTPLLFCFLTISILKVPLYAQDGVGSFTGKISVEAGTDETSDGQWELYQHSRLILQGRHDLTPTIFWEWEGEGNWQNGPQGLSPVWSIYSVRNDLDLEADNFSTSNGADLASIRLDRVSLRYASGSLEVTAGLQAFDWGSSGFYRSTNYFFPRSPLSWDQGPTLGSEALRVNCFLFDDLSLEGAGRLLEGGNSEWVVRLVNKGIGLTVTPSFAWLNGRDGFGLELAGTFPDFKAYVEAVDWFYSDGNASAEWEAGLSTVNKGIVYTAEVLRDGTGRILGNFSDGPSLAAYLYFSAEGSFFKQWKAVPALVTPLEGGPFLLWPKVVWNFSASWEAAFQAQFPLGNWPGALALVPGRAGLSISYSF